MPTSAKLTDRAFEVQEMELWCARNSERLNNVHQSYYYMRQLEYLAKVDWKYYETEAEFIRDTFHAWNNCKAAIRAAYSSRGATSNPR